MRIEKNLESVSSISDSSIEIILHFIKTKLMLVDPLETVSGLEPRGRKLTLTTKRSRKS